MTDLAWSLDHHPLPTLSMPWRAALWMLVVLAHLGVALAVLRLAPAAPTDEALQVLEVQWIAPAQTEPAPLVPPPAPPPELAPPPKPVPARAEPTPAVPRSVPAAADAAPIAPALAPAPAPTPAPVVAATPAAAAPAAATAQATDAQAAPATPLPPKMVAISALRYLEQPKPVYPRVSTELCETGVVTLNILVNEWGVPTEVSVEKSSGYPRLDQSAVKAMRAARFRPYTEGSQARAIRAHPIINFQLEC